MDASAASTALTKTLVLASSSPRRQELIRSLKLPYTIIVSNADETVSAELAPGEIVETLSLRKANAVLEQAVSKGGGIVIGSDTIVVLDGRVLGKPGNEADAFTMLSSLQGRTHLVYSGVACIDTESRESPSGQPEAIVGHTVSKVAFRPMSNEEIEAYVKTGEPLDKAGAYGVQGLGAVFVERIEGDFYSIMGLPLNLLYQMLLKFGISPFKP